VFLDSSAANLFLRAEALNAIDHGMPVGPGQWDDDIDRQMRPVGAERDAGADEFRPARRALLPMAVGQLGSSAQSAEVYQD
jgi:hypothetical protein